MLIYIAGPYTASNEFDTIKNIRYAEGFALEVLQMGHCPFTPHLNFRLFDYKCGLPKSEYLKHDIEILERCDAILMIPNWKSSEGAQQEHNYAKANGIPIYYNVKDIPLCQT